MRDIRFRIYDKVTKYMLDWESIKQFTFEEVIEPPKEDVLMQFTGLKDTNGKEIYEGDVVKVSEPDEDSCMGKEFVYNCEVCFGGGEYRGCFTLKCEEYYRGFALLGYSRNAELEVIGNIYENPELLELKR
jgi:uncharacterized phage protein (TIGR01671 family)